MRKVGKLFKKLFKKLTPLLPAAVLVAKIFVAVNIVLTFYNLIFIGRIFPNVYIAGIDVSGLTVKEANSQLNNKLTLPNKITLTGSDDLVFNLKLDELNIKYDLPQSAESAYNTFRTGNLFYDFATRIDALWNKRRMGLRINYDDQKFAESLSVIAGEVYIEPITPNVVLKDGEVVIEQGRLGRDIDVKKLRMEIGYKLSQADSSPITLQTKRTGYQLTQEEKNILKTRAEGVIGKKLILTNEFQTFILNDSDLLSYLDPKNEYKEKSINDLIFKLAQSIERAPQNPTFVFEENRVKEFAPAKPGIKIDETRFTAQLRAKLNELEKGDVKEQTLAIAVKLTEPDITTDTVNNLGIKELIGRGTSRFTGSISSRLYNINLAATRLNGVLIAPGEEFSFNGALGDVSKLTGYKEAYVILDGKTVLGDGGGVCQVSTTLFRAAMNAGLPITERRAHAYRVSYYEQDAGPGLDATVYSPTTDLKFINDTPAHILIQSYPDVKNFTLAFELYGTSDGRKATITKPVTSNITAPPDDLYIDDPTLPLGTIKQTEHRISGAKSVFNYSVERDGETIYEKTFISNYRPWQAVYLRGTGPVQ